MGNAGSLLETKHMGDFMLERGFWEPMDFVPYAFLPILASAIVFQWWWFMQQVHKSGQIVYRSQFGQYFFVIFNYFANLSILFMLVYSIIVFGWIYLISIPITAIVSIPLTMLGIIPFAHYLMPLAYVFLFACSCVMFGFLNFPTGERFNHWFFSLFWDREEYSLCAEEDIYIKRLFNTESSNIDKIVIGIAAQYLCVISKEHPDDKNGEIALCMIDGLEMGDRSDDFLEGFQSCGEDLRPTDQLSSHFIVAACMMKAVEENRISDREAAIKVQDECLATVEGMLPEAF